MASINYSNASCVPIYNSSNSTDSKYDSTNNFLWIYVAPAIIILGTTGMYVCNDNDNDNDNDNEIDLFRHHNGNNTNIKVIFKQVTMLDKCKCI